MHSLCQACPHRQGNVCKQVLHGQASVHKLQACPIHLWPSKPQQAQTLPDKRIAPFREGTGLRWEGSALWRDIPVSVILPVIEYNRTLDLVLEAIRRQTVKSIVYLIDTGSYLTTDRIAAFRDYRTEVIVMRMQGWKHPSWPVAAALDAAWACIQTPYAFFTHDDCFLKQQTCFEQLIPLVDKHKVVGHQISPRPYPEWVNEFGHTLLMMSVYEMDRIGLSWNMRAFCNFAERSIFPADNPPNDPDTERMMNLTLKASNLQPSFNPPEGSPLFLGTEENGERNNNEWFDHCRSMTCGFLYSNDHAKKAAVWVDSAMKDAQQRMREWK